MKNPKVLVLIASDFKDTSYISNGNCAVSKACKRVLSGCDVRTGSKHTTVNGVLFKFKEEYGHDKFTADEATAKELGFGKDIVRVIELEP